MSFLVILIILFILIWPSMYVVPQQSAYIIERLGKFHVVSFAGLHFKVPFIDRIVSKTTLKVGQIRVRIETKTLDNVFVNVDTSTQFRVNAQNVAKAYYELINPNAQLQSYMEDALRSAIPMLSLDDAFARKDSIALDVQNTVRAEMSNYGFDVIKTLITAIDPAQEVKDAMDSINAAQREKEATKERAEARRIEIETQAAANAEKTRLQGEGQANYRREIANGIVDQIKSLQAVGMDISEVNNVVLFNQYLDVMRSLSESPNAKTVVLPSATPGGYGDLFQQMTAAVAVNDAVREDGTQVVPAPVSAPHAQPASHTQPAPRA